MKHIIYLTILSFLLLAGCSKPSPAPATDPEQYERYIFFSQNVETKASLIDKKADLKDKNIGVVGFKYDKGTDWNTHVAEAPVPNVFYDDDRNIVPVETVACDENGYCTYAPLQGWANTQKYTFFAYYPFSGVELVSTTGADYEGGIPAIKYTMNTASAADFKASMVDVMVATNHENKFWYSTASNNLSSGEIGFEFSHCLSSLGLNMKNSTAGNITVNNVTFNLTGIQNKSIIIPLDGSNKTYGTSAFDIACALTIGEGGIAVPSVTADSDGVEVSDKLILIPQTANLSFTLTVGYKRSVDGYEDNETSYTTPALTTVLTEGKKHIVNLKFTDSTVEVIGEVSEEGWVKIPTVEDTFN